MQCSVYCSVFSVQYAVCSVQRSVCSLQVLEERENERKKEEKFCIDIGTQTHGWQFPDTMELLKQVLHSTH